VQAHCTDRDRAFDLRQHARGVRQKGASGGCELYRTSCSGEDRRADLLFLVANLSTQRRLTRTAQPASVPPSFPRNTATERMMRVVLGKVDGWWTDGRTPRGTQDHA